MNAIESVLSVDKFELYFSKLAKLSLFLYLFFLFFGTALPFQNKIVDTAEFESANRVNQIIFSTLYMLSFICLLFKRGMIVKLVKKEKFLTIFLLWALLSVFWSDFPTVSFKRWIRIFGGTIIFLSALLQFRKTEEALEYFKVILYIYIPVSFLSIIFIPEAIQWKFPAWRGIASHKNELGQVSLVSLIIWSCALHNKEIRNQIVAFLFLILSLVLLIGARSATSLTTGFFLIALLGLLYAERKILRPVIGKVFSVILISSFALILFLILYFAPEAQLSILKVLGKDLTISGRTGLWSAVFQFTQKKLIFGYGISSFWDVNNYNLMQIYQDVEWFPNQSHMGYLDILNETGIIGISIFTLMVLSVFKEFWRLESSYLWKYLIVCIMILNFTESTLFRINELTGFLFIFSYIAIYLESLNYEHGAV
jgi:O-antigen ligase